MTISLYQDVIYIGASDEQVQWGGNDDPRGILIEGKHYEIERKEMHSWHTKIILREFPGKKFNSECFETVSDGQSL